uniref:Uncharacterized protein n=1 Tax=Plectus sambesii TaxID=2011161 RepID=A0A914WEJ0_9BILA
MAKRTKPLKFNRVYCFFALFCTVYFLESIGGVYMVSAIQSIERQFQIPSKMSGLMISAGDFGYIPTVAITSYMGSKGNRARWIGGGCLLIAGANFMISTPNFIFRAPVLEPNLTKIAELLSPPVSLTYDNVTAEELLNYTLINEKIPEDVRKQWINNISQIQTSPKLRVRRDVTDPDLQDVELTTLLFERLFSEVTTPDPRFREMEYTSSEAPTDKDTEELETAAKMIIDGQNITESFVYLKDIIKRRYIKAAEEARREAVAPFGYCSAVVNTLRKVIADMKCERDYTNTGPFLIIFMALFFLGIGRTMPWSLGVPLIDDNVKRKNLPVYFAGMFFIRILGPILGFSIGSFCNRIYFNLNPPEGLSPRDPTWIGAWWLGFMVISAVLFGPSLALFCFPNPESKSSDSDSESNDNDIDPEPAFDGEKKNRVPQKKRKRELALVDRHVRKTED